MEKNYKERLNRITTFCFDVDGVFTNGIVMLMDNGEQLRTANVRDGYAVQLAVKKGYRVVIISGGRQEAVRKRFEGLGVKDVFLGAEDKVKVFEEYIATHDIDPETVCYMGDDIPDYKVMQKVGLPCCPANAVQEIKSVSKYVSPQNGGDACVRDILEQTMKAQGKWMDNEAHTW